MPNVKTFQRAFAGGEISPEMFGRIDDMKYQMGLATCRNFVVKPTGPVENRAGFQFVREVKNSTKKTRLISFTYNTTQTMVVELGAGYFRFHTAGATLLSGTISAWVAATAYVVGDMRSNSGTKYYCTTAHTSGTFATDLAAGKWYAMPSSGEYEIPNPYAEADLFDINYVQSADVLTLVHPNYAPRELRRLGASTWTLTTVSFSAPISAPTGITAVQTGTGTNYTYSYVVTATAADLISESAASASASVACNLYTTGNFNTIAWGAVSGASLYNVYKMQGGVYGYIGQTSGTSLVDDNIAADLSICPPTYDSVFESTGNYPGAVSYYEQRRWFGGTTNAPQNVWATRSGTESTMAYSLPIRDDDRISIRVAAREANTIRHIVPLSQLMLLTSAAEWRVTSVNSDAITPTSISVKPQSYVGANTVQPVIVNTNMIYIASRGGHARECSYNWQANGFITGDLSLRTAHLFDGYDVVDQAYAKAPTPIVWMVSSSGKLLGVTYIPEQQIGAWHQHDTDGLFEACTTVEEGGEDVLYCTIKRTIGGATKRYVECMHVRSFTNQEDAFFVDSGVTYSGSATTTITGLSHLEGKTVSILSNGAVHPQRVVTSGQITLEHSTTKAHIGLPIVSDIETLPVAVQVDAAFGQGRTKNVNKANVRVYRSSGVWVGPDTDNLIEYKQRTTEPYGTAPALKSEDIEIVLSPSWGDSGSVFIRQSDPLPLTICSLALEVAIGG